jgi:hypothetical protein
MRRTRLAIAGAVVAAAFLAAGAALAAAPSGSLTETIDVGVRSLTVSPPAVSICSPASPLTSPNGDCPSSDFIAVTNGPVGGHIDVNGTDAVPSDGGTHWTLCSYYVDCAGPGFGSGHLPGSDQYATGAYQTYDQFGDAVGPFLENSPECDTSWSGLAGARVSGLGVCVPVSANQTASEYLYVRGPSSSTDQSPTFTTSVTWTAVP